MAAVHATAPCLNGSYAVCAREDGTLRREALARGLARDAGVARALTLGPALDLALALTLATAVALAAGLALGTALCGRGRCGNARSVAQDAALRARLDVNGALARGQRLCIRATGLEGSDGLGASHGDVGRDVVMGSRASNQSRATVQIHSLQYESAP